MGDLLKKAQEALNNSAEELKEQYEKENEIEWEYEDGAILYDANEYAEKYLIDDDEPLTIDDEEISDEDWFIEEKKENKTEAPKEEPEAKVEETEDNLEDDSEEFEETEELDEESVEFEESDEEIQEEIEDETDDEQSVDTSKLERVEKKSLLKDRLANMSASKIKKRPTFEKVEDEEDDTDTPKNDKVQVFNFHSNKENISNAGGKKFILREHETGEEGSVIERLKRLGIGVLVFFVGLLFYKLIKKTIWVGVPFFIIAYVILGYDVILRAVGRVLHGKVFDENFLMSLASLAALCTGNFAEAVIVMLLYQIGEFLEDVALGKSRKSIADLMNIRPEVAHVNRGQIMKVHPRDVAIGDIVVVRPGERIPLDGVVETGKSYVDTSALTGEPVPRRVHDGDEVLAGYINKDGLLNIRVTKLYGETIVSKILKLVEEASEKKAPAERFITKFSRYYTPAMIALALIIAIIPSIITKKWKIWVYRACILLVISCPCALVISVPLAFFAGLGIASRNGILVKGSNFLEALDNVDTVVFDKTGTLTKGTFGVTQVSGSNDFKEDQLLTLAAHAECLSTHPIAKSIMDLYYKNGGKHINREQITNYKEIPGHGVSVVVGKHLILAGNSKLMRAANISFTESTSAGSRVYVAADGQYAGFIDIADEVKEDARDGIGELKLSGVAHTVMLTGDNTDAAAAVAKTVGVEKYYAELLPDDKVKKLEEVMRGAEGIGLVAFMGDGINDAPVLRRADIGIAMGGIGSDAAIEAADVVIMDDQPSKLVDAINIARDTKMIVKENIIGSLAVKALLLLLGVLGVANMWFAVFGDVGVMLLAIFNTMRLMKK